MPKIIFVKKVFPDGTSCRKCNEVLAKLEKTGNIDSISRTVIAQENEPNSEGMILARLHNMDNAPFFIIENDDQTTEVIEKYSDLAQRFFGIKKDDKDELLEFMNDHPDLDYI